MLSEYLDFLELMLAVVGINTYLFNENLEAGLSFLLYTYILGSLDVYDVFGPACCT